MTMNMLNILKLLSHRLGIMAWLGLLIPHMGTIAVNGMANHDYQPLEVQSVVVLSVKALPTTIIN